MTRGVTKIQNLRDVQSVMAPQTDRRNVADFYKYWATDAIRARLDSLRHEFAVLCQNIEGDFNIGSVIRNCNAFLASSIYYWGNKRWNRRGTVGTHIYENIKFIDSEANLQSLFEQYAPVCIDNVDGAINIFDYEWPKNPLMIFGEECAGIQRSILDKNFPVLYIPQYGSVRSLNVGCASAIAMADWCRKNVQ